jgi:tetratricopeptide (TPR) repeat protein
MKLNKIIFLIFIVSLGISESPETLLSSGQTKLAEGDLQGALTDFQLALEQDNKFDLAMLELAQLQLRLGNMEKAKELLFRAVEVNEENRKEFDRFNDINIKMNDGGRAMKNGQYEEAFSNYEVVVKEFPNFTEAVYSMGLANFRLADFESAVKYFSEALELNPEHVNARTAIDNVVKNTFNEGNNSYRRGNLEGAMEAYHQVLGYDSTFVKAHYQIGVIEAKRGNLSVAIDSYSQAINIDSTFYQGWFALGLALNKYGDKSGALESFQQAVTIHPGYAKAYSSMGDIYVQNKEFEKAIEVLKTAISVNEGYGKPYISLGAVYTDLDSIELAITYLEKGTSLNPKDAAAWVRLASAHNRLGNCESAKGAAREATDRKKRFGAGWYELGIAEWCNGKGNKTAGLNALEKARDDRSWRQMAEYEIDRIKNPEKYEE